MKKILVFIITFGLFIGCASMEQVPQQDREFEKVINVSNIKKAKLFDIANRWMADSFKSSKSVIEYTDKEAGVIMGNYNYSVSGIGTLAAYSYDLAENKITLNFRDNGIKIKISHTAIHVVGSGINTWRAPSLAEFKDINFKENCELTAKSLEKYIKDFDKNSNW